MHGAEEWEEFLLPEIKRQEGIRKEITFWREAAFANPEVHEVGGERRIRYVVRIPAN